MQLQCPLSTEGFQPRGCQNALNKSPGIVLSLPEVCSQLGRAGRWGEAAHPSPEGNELGRDSGQSWRPCECPALPFHGSASFQALLPTQPLLQGWVRVTSAPAVMDVTSRGAGCDFQALGRSLSAGWSSARHSPQFPFLHP